MFNDEDKEKGSDKAKSKKMKFFQKVKQSFKRKPSEDKPPTKRISVQEPSTSSTAPKQQWKYDPNTKQLCSDGIPWGPGAHRFSLQHGSVAAPSAEDPVEKAAENTKEEKSIKLSSITISWENYMVNDGRSASSNTIEDLLARRCRCPAFFDNISASAAASKFWIMLHFLRGNCPPILPGMSLRQMIVFRKLMQATDGLDLPLQNTPPMGFQKFVEKLWTDDNLCANSDGTPEDLMPDDLEKMDDLVMEREERIFVLGGSVAEVLKSWMDDFEEKTFFATGLFDSIEVIPSSLLKGFALEPSDDFITIMQPVALSADFIAKLNITQGFMASVIEKTGIRSRYKGGKRYRMKIDLKPSEINKLVNIFWGESSAPNEAEYVEIEDKNWMSDDRHLQWLADSIKRKPRRILGLNIRYEKQRQEAEDRKRERLEVESIMRNTEFKAHMPWDGKQQQSTSTTFAFDSIFSTDLPNDKNSSQNNADNISSESHLEGSCFDGAEPFTELKFDKTTKKVLSCSFDEPIPMDPCASWTDVDELPPSTISALRTPSRATVYSTDSELSTAFCRMSVDKMSLQISDSEWADIDRLAQP